MFGAEKGNQLRDLVLGEGVLKAGHLLAAVFDLRDDLRGLHGLADMGQRWTFLGSLRRVSMAVGATLVAEKHSSRSLGGFRIGRDSKRCAEREDAEKGQGRERPWKPDFESNHLIIFSLFPRVCLMLWMVEAQEDSLPSCVQKEQEKFPNFIKNRTQVG